jgi:chloramphenicol-sensitive protein RarD
MSKNISTKKPQKQKEALIGVLNAIGAFLIWGLSPIYFKALAHVPAFEILLHRMVWSFIFLFPIVIFTGRWKEFSAAIANRKTLLILIGTTLLVSCNWFVFIWAINSGKILHTSLGYFINPIINVLLGMLFLKERLRPAQTVAVILAMAGVFYMTIEIGTLPWVSLFLAFSFGFYGLIRKTAAVNALVGLTVETMLLFFPASVYLYYIGTQSAGTFLAINVSTDLLLMGAALVTALPLLLYTAGARRIHFATIGMLQYIAPSSTFILAVYIYNEPFQTAQIRTFILIWISLIIYSADSVIASRSGNRKNK